MEDPRAQNPKAPPTRTVPGAETMLSRYKIDMHEYVYQYLYFSFLFYFQIWLSDLQIWLSDPFAELASLALRTPAERLSDAERKDLGNIRAYIKGKTSVSIVFENLFPIFIQFQIQLPDLQIWLSDPSENLRLLLGERSPDARLDKRF